ncbi:CBS domain-containing protein, partial [Oleiphilus sp. HI0128]
HPETQVEDLAPALLEYGLDAIAVFENQQIVGIVTHPDILKTILLKESLEADA